MDTVVHCLDYNLLKSRSLSDVFPAICRCLSSANPKQCKTMFLRIYSNFSLLSRFPIVTYNCSGRRAAAGARNGCVAFYEIKNGRTQMLQVHKAPVTALAYSPDAKYLASFCVRENKLVILQVSTDSTSPLFFNYLL